MAPLAGGEHRKTGLKVANPNLNYPPFLRIHPDGRQAAFVAGKRNFEVWVMENFLPTLSASR